MYNENYLSHYGVKGMKWGVRRSPQQFGHKPTKLKSTDTSSEKTRRSSLSKSETTSELRKRISTDEGWLDLNEEICTRSGDWYDSKGVSEGFKKAVKNHDDTMNRIRDKYYDRETAINNAWSKQMTQLEKTYPLKNPVEESKLKKIESELMTLKGKRRVEETIEESRYDNEILGIVLKDLDYNDSPEAREIIREVVISD